MLPGKPLSYILDGVTPVVEPDPLVWDTWMRAALRDGRRVVAKSKISPRINVSTVFTGSDESLAETPDPDNPFCFETAIFEDGEIVDTRYYTTWNEALAGHAERVAALGGAT